MSFHDINIIYVFRSILQAVDSNLFFVDWSVGARTLNYYDARMRVNGVGRVLGKFVKYLEVYFAVVPDQVSMIGFSLGGISNKF